jgi:RNA polymerase II subunit A small phosphatase-like protein
MQENFGSAANTSLHALDLLGEEVFFTSPRLAALSTQTEVLMQQWTACAALPRRAVMEAAVPASALAAASSAAPASSQLLEDYQCPICLDTLHNPVVLTCAHRFCWGCLVAHTASSRSTHMPLMKPKQSRWSRACVSGGELVGTMG